MLFAFVFSILLFVTNTHSTPTIDVDNGSTCNVLINRYSQCTARVESIDSCTSAILNFTDTSSAQCMGINYLWTQAANNLTIIIETPSLMELVTNVYEIINNREINVTTQSSILTINSDVNYQVVVKLQTPAKSTVSAIGIRYKATKS